MLELAKDIIFKLNKVGGKTLIVGGYVRDKLLGICSKDIDLEVFKLSKESVERVLSEYGNVNFVGKQYGIYKVGNIDIGIPRIERKNGLKHTDFDIETIPDMAIELAAKRRDLTINAIYYDILTGNYIDPYNGIIDLVQLKLIKFIDAFTFVEDPLRVIRAARFKSIFPQLNVSENTAMLCRSFKKDSIISLPKDRIFIELEKALMKSKMPSIFFHALDMFDVTPYLFPELELTKYIEQGHKYHPEGSVFNHTMMALDILPIIERELDVMLALLFHDLGKIDVKAEKIGDDHISFKGHQGELTSVNKALRRLTDDNNLLKSVTSLVSHHMCPYDFKKETYKRKHLRRLATKVDIPKLIKVHTGDKFGRGYINPNSKCLSPGDLSIEYDTIKNEITPLISGRDLIDMGLCPGKDFKRILNDIFEAQLNEQFVTKEEGLSYLKEYLSNR